jgi:glucokinase
MTSACAIGVDVGGTKCAAGLLLLPEGRLVARRLIPTEPGRGGQAVLADVIQLARELRDEAPQFAATPTAIGVGVAELVGHDGRVLSDATIGWKELPIADAIQQAAGLPVCIEADVRAAARAEAQLGAGRGRDSFLYVTVGTGISACLILKGAPFVGARGLTGTFASSRGLIPGDDGRLAAGPPLEQFAAGPALAKRFAAMHQNRAVDSREVVARCEAGDESARWVTASAGEALGAAIGQVVNLLDPEIVVIGGGLGLVGGAYRQSIDSAMRAHIWSELHREIPLVSAQLGADSGVIGAALAAATVDSQLDC